jgi:hypothetical protein
MAVFWVVAPCTLVSVYQRFEGPYCLQHRPSHFLMEAVRITETLLNLDQCTRRSYPKDGHLHTHCRESPRCYIPRAFTIQNNAVYTQSLSANAVQAFRVYSDDIRAWQGHCLQGTYYWTKQEHSSRRYYTSLTRF